MLTSQLRNPTASGSHQSNAARSIRVVGVLLGLIGASFNAPQAHAAPVWGDVVPVRQPDGTVHQVRVWGDEFYQVVESLDGYTLVRDEDTGVVCYADVSFDGTRLMSTGVALQANYPGGVGLVPHMRIDADAANAERDAQRARFAEGMNQAAQGLQFGPNDPMFAPTTGSVLGLTLLVDFSDEVGTVASSDIDDYLNMASYSGNGNNGSVFDYFFDVSDGMLSYANNVTATYYRAANPKSYYDDGNPVGAKALELVQEALQALETAGHDFSQYDADGDNIIDAVNIFYAGNRTAFATGLWPHSWVLQAPYTFSADGVSAVQYQMTDIGAGLTLGTFCHENGHMLMDWPDLYDANGGSLGIGDYCLMGTLAASATDTNPPEPSAYLKELAGWATVTSLTSSQSGLSVPAGTNTFYKYVNPDDSNEFFIFENRRKTARDAAIPDEGLAVWHIDLNVADSCANCLSNRTEAMHYQASLEQADGSFHLENNVNYGDTTDLYHSGGVTTFDGATTPNSDWWDGTDSNMTISNVSVAGASVTFDFDNGSGVGIDLDIATIAGQQAGTPFSVTVNALDIFGDPGTVSHDTLVTLSLNTGTGNLGGTLAGTMMMGTGTVVISGVTYDEVENGVVLDATASGGDTLTPDTSNAFNVGIGAASQLNIETIANQAAGVPFDVVVDVEDNLGNAAGVTGLTLITLSVNSGTGTLSGTVTGVISTGQSTVTIPDISYDVAESGVVIRAAASGPGGGSLSADDSNSFNVSAGAVVGYQVATIGTQIANAPFDVGITTIDAEGNVATVGTDTTVGLSVASGTGTLSGTVVGVIPNGSSSFTISNVSYSKIENNVRLRASGSGLTLALSNLFNVGVGTPSVFSIGTIGTQNAGVNFDLSLTTQDAYGNTAAVSGDTAVTLTRATGTGTLAGTLTGTISNGSSTATIVGINYDTAESGVSIQVAASGFTNGTSNTFSVNAGPADRLAVETVATQGLDVPFDVVVTATDEFDQAAAVTADTLVTFTKKSGSSAAGTLGGTRTGTITAGTSSVTIAGLTWDTAEMNVELTATASGGDTLTAIDTNAFTVELRNATKLGIDTIANHAGGTPFDVTVNVLDAMDLSAAVTQNTHITLTVSSGTGTLFGTTSGTISAGDRNIVFSGLDYNVAQSGIVITATATSGDSLTAAMSNAFTVTAGPAQLVTPANDGDMLTDTTYTFEWNTGANVTQYRLWVGSSPLNTSSDADIYRSAALTGNSQEVTGIPSDGSNVYVNLYSYINGAFQVNSYTFTAPSAGVATHLNFAAIADQTAGTPFTVTVRSEDVLGSLANVTQDTGVQVSLNTGTGMLSGTLTGTISNGTSSVMISSLNYTMAGTGVSLTAASTAGDSLFSGDSASFTVAADAPAKLSVGTIEDVGTNVAFDVAVTALDAYDNPANVTSTTTVTLTKTSGNMATGTLAGTRTVAIAAGESSGTISGALWTADDTGIQLTATPTAGMTGLTVAMSNTFTAATRTPTKLLISTIPAQGRNIPFDVTVMVVNASDEVANVSMDTVVTLSLDTGTGTLGGTLTGTITNGTSMVTISGVTYSAYENGIVLDCTATSGMTGLTAATSNAFNVTTKTAELTAPANDGDTLTGASYTFAWNTGAGATQYRLWVGSAPLTSDPSSADIYRSVALTGTSQNVTGLPTDGSNVYVRLYSYINSAFQSVDYTFVAASAGVATHLEVQAIGSQTAGSGFGVGVKAVDALGTDANVTQDTRVALSVQSGTGMLSGTTFGTISNGTNSFTIPGVIYSAAESGVVLRATATAGDTLISDDSAAFTVNGGAAAKLAIDTIGDQGTNVGFDVVVNVLDAADNPANVTSQTTITLTKTSGNMGSGTVGGVTTGVIDPGNGTVTISGVIWDMADTGVQLTATPTAGMTGLTVAMSNTFTVATRTPTKLGFATIENQGTNLPFDVTVNVLDASDLPANVTMATQVTLSLNSGSGNLGGTLTGTIANGESSVTISGVTYDATETGIILTGTPTTGMTSLTVATSNAFDVGNKKASLTTPANDGDTLTGANYTFVWNTGSGVTQYRLWIGSAAITSDPLTADIYRSTALTGTSQAVTGLPTDGSTVYVRLHSYINGAFQFNDYTFTAASAGVASVVRLGSTSTQTAGTPFSLNVESVDALGDPIAVTQDTRVALSVATGTGTLGGTTFGTIPNGSSSFTIGGITYNKAESGVVLRGTSVAGDTLTADTSDAFTVNAGTPTKLSIDTIADQATNVEFDVVVTALDENDNIADVTSATTITLSKTSGNMATGTLTGQQTGVISNGASSVTISGAVWDMADTGVTLTATPTTGMTGLTIATSNSFTVATRVPTKLAISTIGNQGTGLPFDVTVRVLDASDLSATVTTTTTVTLSLNMGSGTLGGTLSTTIGTGAAQATISGVTYDMEETGVILTCTPTAGMTGLTVATSNAFNVGDAPAQMTTPTNDGDTLTGASYAFRWNAGVGATQYRLWVGSAAVTTDPTTADIYRSAPLTVTNATVAGLPTDGSTVYVRLYSYVNSVWQFRDYSYEAATAGVATTISVDTIGNQVAGTPFSVRVQTVDALDVAYGVSQDTQVTLSVATGNGTLAGTLVGTIPNGSSSFTISGVTYDVAEANVTIQAAATAGDTLNAGTSNAFEVSGGTAAKLSIANIDDQGTNVGFDVVVSVLDANDNPALASMATTVTLTKTSGNMGTGTVAGVTSAVIDGGEGSVTISGVLWNAADTGVQLTATPTAGLTSLTVAMSNTFTVANRTPAKLAIDTIENQGPGQPFDVSIRVLDSSDLQANCTQVTTVTLSVSSGTGSLSGTVSGTIGANSGTLTIRDISYSTEETGVVLTATASGGDVLTAGLSNAFEVGDIAAEMTNPENDGDTLSSDTVTFTWTTGSGASQYRLWVGSGPITSAPASADIYRSVAITGTSQTVGSLPMDGSDVYVRLFSLIDGVYQYNDYQYVAASNGVATRLIFNPVGSQQAGEPFAVSVQTQDAFGSSANVIADTGVTISVAVGAGALSGTLTGTIPAGSSSATISNMSYDTLESDVQLRATRTAGDTLTSAVSLAFDVSAGAPAAMSIQTIGAQGAGDAFDVVVDIEDQFGNTAAVTQDTLITLTKSPMSMASGTLASAVSGTITTGMSSFTLSGAAWDTVEGGAQIRATASGGDTLTDADSNTFTVTVGAPATLAIATIGNQMTSTSFAVRVNVEDTLANASAVTQDTTITLSKQSGSMATGTLGGTLTATLIGGQTGVTISGLTWSAADTNVVLTASASGGDVLTGTSSNTFDVSVGGATTYTLSTVTGVTAGDPFAINVTARDPFGNAANVSQDTRVVMSLKNGTGSIGGVTFGTISNGTSSVNISGITYNKLEGNVRLTATITSGDNLGGPVDTNFFNVGAGSAAALSVDAIAQQRAGVNFDVGVRVLDQFGNLTTVSQDTGVSLSKQTGSGFTGTLAGAISGTIANGASTFTFSGVNWNAMDSDVIVTAARTAGDTLSSDDSDTFDVIEGPASDMTMVITDQQAGEPFSVTVTTTDQYGNASAVATDTTIALSKTSGLGLTGTLAGTMQGVVTSGNSSVSIGTVYWTAMETGVQLTSTRVSGDTLNTGTSNTFTVTAGNPSQVVVSTIGNQVAGTGFDVGIETQDQYGNTANVLVDTRITLSVQTGTGVLSGTRVGTVSMGSATFTISGATYDTAETGVSLRAAASLGFPLTAGTSNTFTVTPGAVASMTVDTVSTQAAGVPFDVRVNAIDGFGNGTTVTQDTRVTLTVATGTGAIGGTVFATIANGSNGATISGVTYDTAETGVVFDATASGGDALGVVQTNAFQVTGGPATAITIDTIDDQGLDVPFDVTVNAVDQFGNSAQVSANTGITLSKTSGISATGTLSGNLSGTIASGGSSVTFSGVAWDTEETGVQLTATRTSGDALGTVSSNTFTVEFRPAAKLGFQTISDPAVNDSFDVVVQVLDASDNPTTVTQNTGVVVALNTGTGTLSGTLSRTITTGSTSVTFSNLSYNVIESGVVLQVTRTSGDVLTSATSAAFDVVAGFKAEMTLPVDGATLSGSSETFQWSTGVNVTQYRLWVGSNPLFTSADADIFRSSALVTTSQLVTGIPTDGSTIYVRVYSYINGVFESNDYTYTASGPAPAPPDDPNPAPPELIASDTPTNGDNVEEPQQERLDDEPFPVTPQEIIVNLSGGGLCGMGSSMTAITASMALLMGAGWRRRRRRRVW